MPPAISTLINVQETRSHDDEEARGRYDEFL